MKLLIIRHGDPDYVHDTLTERGWKEAELLSIELVKVPADEYYVSPLGRARDTASCTMKKLGTEPVVLDWLQEFPARIIRPDQPGRENICWDWLPQDWTVQPVFYSAEHWYDNQIMQDGNVKQQYEHVVSCFDSFLAEHGYRRDGNIYRVEKANCDTIVLFCHFGLEGILISRLLSISPMTVWHGMAAAPTSVTTIVTEERRPGIASFRMLRFGDVSHLTKHGMEPSFSARFCEKYGKANERVD